MSYSSSSAVGAMCRNLLGEFATFTESSCPSRAQVDGWLSSGCSILESVLGTAGYSTPVASTSQAYGWLTDLNTLFGAARAEMSRSNAMISPGERTRGQVFQELFETGVEKLLKMDLTKLGVSKVSGGRMYAGGISVSDIATWEADTDRPAPMFNRGQFKFPGTVDPTTSTACQY
jgi:hypothetical protein